MILGGAIWVAIAKSKIKHENPDDLERGGNYEAVNTDEQTGKYNEFELGDMSDDEDGHVGSSSSSAPGSPDRNQIGETVGREVSLDVAETGESREERQ